MGTYRIARMPPVALLEIEPAVTAAPQIEEIVFELEWLRVWLRRRSREICIVRHIVGPEPTPGEFTKAAYGAALYYGRKVSPAASWIVHHQPWRMEPH